MKLVTKAMIILGLLVGSAFSAMADSKWTFENVLFDNGNMVNGWFTLNPTSTAYDSFSITVTGPATAQAFTASIVVSSYLPSEIGFANADFSRYLALYLTAPMTSAGGDIPLGPGLYGNGFDCGGGGGCGTLLLGGVYNPYVHGVSPEPSGLLLLGTGLGPIAFWLRRKLS